MELTKAGARDGKRPVVADTVTALIIIALSALGLALLKWNDR